jgi:hypothetical protein
MKYVNFNDKSLPIGKRKQAYVKWAVSQGTELKDAQRQANRKFGFEQKEGIFAIVEDFGGRSEQRSFTGAAEIFQMYDLRKFKRYDYAIMHDPKQQNAIKKQFEEKGWDVVFVSIHA